MHRRAVCFDYTPCVAYGRITHTANDQAYIVWVVGDVTTQGYVSFKELRDCLKSQKYEHRDVDDVPERAAAIISANIAPAFLGRSKRGARIPLV